MITCRCLEPTVGSPGPSQSTECASVPENQCHEGQWLGLYLQKKNTLEGGLCFCVDAVWIKVKVGIILLLRHYKLD